DQLHRKSTPGDRRIQTPTTPHIVKSPKTFWTARKYVQLPDGTVIWTAPNGRTYTTRPGS
ncbi:MAG: hypothetical protein K2X56_13950, partial [Mycobacterium pseudokansasii]|nr:hypothetical protein [Mycobacterium pseudokansasii]